jgi:hypothetical protein
VLRLRAARSQSSKVCPSLRQRRPRSPVGSNNCGRNRRKNWPRSHRATSAKRAQVASEIRQYVRQSKAPAATALGLKNDKRAMQAIASAPPYLSGLNEAELASVQAVLLNQSEHQPAIVEAENVLKTIHGAVRSARAMIAERVFPGDLDAPRMTTPAKVSVA